MTELILNLLMIVRILSAAVTSAGALMIAANIASEILYKKPVKWLIWKGLEYEFKGIIIYTISLMIKLVAENHGII